MHRTFNLSYMYTFLSKLSICLLLFMQIQGCSAQKKKTKIKSLSVNSLMPIVERDGSMTSHDKSYSVFYFEDLICYKCPYTLESALSGQSLKLTEKYFYFIFQKDSAFGYTFDRELKKRDGKRSSVDSVLKIIKIDSRRFDKILNVKPNSIVIENNSNKVTEIYRFDRDSNPINNYIMELTFNPDLNWANESLSKKADSARGTKLEKILIKFQEAFNEEYGILFPKREFSFILKEVTLGNEKEILELFGRYKQFNQHLR